MPDWASTSVEVFVSAFIFLSFTAFSAILFKSRWLLDRYLQT
jgi:hypothetical protein